MIFRQIYFHSYALGYVCSMGDSGRKTEVLGSCAFIAHTSCHAHHLRMSIPAVPQESVTMQHHEQWSIGRSGCVDAYDHIPLSMMDQHLAGHIVGSYYLISNTKFMTCQALPPVHTSWACMSRAYLGFAHLGCLSHLRHPIKSRLVFASDTLASSYVTNLPRLPVN